ncbi:citrate/2-methylcitrate synthase [Georgenia soli]|uniref:citrate/2-methylcitrate synthase n=1 Tax=Georgenia soli TaxID=638953 RepID=UPI00147395A3|nr:citrate/2-methylcitrate synthase [Georgenia soli]
MTPTTPSDADGARPPIFSVDDDGGPVYRGRAVGGLAGTSFDRVWGLLAGDGDPLPRAEPFNLPVRTGDTRADVLSALAQLTPAWSYRPLPEIDQALARENLARASAMMLSFVAQSARGYDVPAVPQREVDLADTATERFLVRWRGEADPTAVRALDTFWLAVAENGVTPSTQTARLAAEVGADAASCLAASVAVGGGPFLGGAVARGLAVVEEVDRAGDARRVVEAYADANGGSLPGFTDGLPTDLRARLLRDACVDVGARHLEAGEAIARAAHEMLLEQGRTTEESAANTMFWGAILLDHLGVAAPLMCALYLCGRSAGWSAHVLDVHASLSG